MFHPVSVVNAKTRQKNKKNAENEAPLLNQPLCLELFSLEYLFRPVSAEKADTTQKKNCAENEGPLMDQPLCLEVFTLECLFHPDFVEKADTTQKPKKCWIWGSTPDQPFVWGPLVGGLSRDNIQNWRMCTRNEQLEVNN